MTTQKDFKRVVRSRMLKTGESYTSARAQLLLSDKSQTAAPQDGKTAKVSPADYGDLAGMSDAAIKKGTGCGWSNWVKSLDHAGAHEWPHRAIAQYVHDKYQTPDWWTQTVAVGYERIKGLRVRGQQRGGSFRTTKSKTFDIPISQLYTIFKRQKFTVRSATKNKYIHITWADGTNVSVGFVAKGRSKSQVAVEHSKLSSKADVERVKAMWAERLEALI